LKIKSGRSVLSTNERQAALNRRRLDALGLVAVNVLASPGAGKTSLLTRLLRSIPSNLSLGVIEGDVAGRLDTDRILAMGFPATQINTGGGCHLDADMIARAVRALDIEGPGYLFIENIGNLICPAEFRLGERLRIVVASVPEGDDKPVKYPGVFASANAVVLNKIDLLGHVEFDMEFFLAGVRAVNPEAPVFNVSCRTGEGVDALTAWLLKTKPRRPARACPKGRPGKKPRKVKR
jgi:hydrogenase nickel incorporation protein HypB